MGLLGLPQQSSCELLVCQDTCAKSATTAHASLYLFHILIRRFYIVLCRALLHSTQELMRRTCHRINYMQCLHLVYTCHVPTTSQLLPTTCLLHCKCVVVPALPFPASCYFFSFFCCRCTPQETNSVLCAESPSPMALTLRVVPLHQEQHTRRPSHFLLVHKPLPCHAISWAGDQATNTITTSSLGLPATHSLCRGRMHRLCLQYAAGMCLYVTSI